ncbi:MAG: histidine kinase, partial [Halieaceae bacterium]|nr:histidine kinase [Halieaceae bacterium]
NPMPAGVVESAGNHMALANVEQRLLVTYGSSAGLKVIPGEGTFTVELTYSPEQGL